MTNIQVKQLLGRVMGGAYSLVSSTVPFYPRTKLRAATVTAKTADYTVVDADLNTPKLFTNTGASGTIVFTLPAVKASAGKSVRVAATAAQIVRLLPQTGEIINLNGSIVVTKYLNVAGVISNYAEVFSDGIQWIVTDYNGVVTKEA